MILGRFIGKPSGGSKNSEGRRRPEDNVLKASEGYFKNGILDVKHLLHQTPSRENDTGTHVFNKGKKKGVGKKRGKKGGGKNRH